MNDKIKRYLNLAKEISTWSKDPSTKIGCVAINEKDSVVAQGFNGFPRKINDTPERWDDRPTKYRYVVHAEANCIYNANYNGVSLDGCSMYIYGLPCCSECAKALIQCGVKEVHMLTTKQHDKWDESFKLTKELFEEVGIKYGLYSNDFQELV